MLLSTGPAPDQGVAPALCLTRYAMLSRRSGARAHPSVCWLSGSGSRAHVWASLRWVDTSGKGTMTAAAELAALRRTEETRTALRRVQRQLEKAKATKEDLAAEVYRAARDAAEGIELPPIPKPAPQKTKGTPEIAIAVLSDWQLAKVTPTYNSDVCEKRVGEYAQAVEMFTAMHRAAVPVRELRVYVLGDIVEGELIFPGQAHRIDSSLYAQVVERGPTILATFLRRMAATFERIHVVTCIGNHGAIGGRSRREMHPETNADAMLYEITRLLTRDEKRITWTPSVVRGERLWHAMDTIGDRRYFLFHGDQVRGGFLGGYSWYGFGQKLLKWSGTRDIGAFDYSFSGHFHTPVRFKAGPITHYGNGTTESSNTYALEQLAAQGEPSQWLLFAHPRRGIVSEHEVRLG